MKIIKRNGAEESFDTLKIVNAVQKACNATENAYLAPEQLTDIADYVEYKCNKLGRAVSVEEIQDMVENQLMAIGAFAIAKNYVRYRYDRSLVRKGRIGDGDDGNGERTYLPLCKGYRDRDLAGASGADF